MRINLTYILFQKDSASYRLSKIYRNFAALLDMEHFRLVCL